MVELLDSKEIDKTEDFWWELENLQKNFFDIKKESFNAKQELKDEVKRLGFYNWDENWENIKFNIDNIRKYLETIKNKSWSDLDVNSSELEKWIWTISIQLSINYINRSNWWTANNINVMDGIRGNQTWRWVKEFQTTYWLRNKDGLPWHETITKILEILPNNGWEYSHDDNPIEQRTWNTPHENHVLENGEYSTQDEYIENENFLKSRLYNENINDNKCMDLLKNFKIDGLNNKWHGIRNKRWQNFENRLKDRIVDEWTLEWVILKNPEFTNLLSAIVSHQAKEIVNMRTRFSNKKSFNNEFFSGNIDESSNEEGNEIVQSTESYEFENSSLDSFENFILSKEWIAIIIDEIKAHIDTNHENEDGKHDRFNERYPFSLINLEVKLRNAREDKMLWEYYKKNRPDDLEELAKMHIMSNKIAWYVDMLVWEYRIQNKESFNQEMVTTLEWFLSRWIYWVGLIEMFYGDENKELRDIFKWVLSNNIKSYEWFVRNENDEFIFNTLDKQTALQLKSYLYLYWRIFYPEHFKANREPKYYEEILPEVMKVIISNDDKSLINKIKHKEFLETERKLEEKRKERDFKRRQEAARRNRERNERLQATQRIDRQSNFGEIQTNKSFNPNQATWPEIAAEANLDLSNYEVNIEESEYRNEWKKETAFRNAWKDFIQSHDRIKSIITQDQMRRIFDLNSNSIDNSQWQNFIKANPILKDMPPETIEKIYTSLSGFSSYFTDAEKRLSLNSSEMKVKVNETIKTYAIGTVIDNVRDTFSTITDKGNNNSEWFQLNEISPLEMVDGDNIILSGKFDGSDIKVRYNLKTGDLFMNSFLDKINPDKISILKNPSTNHRIWNIKTFSDLLNDYYKLPSHNNQIGIINRPEFTNWATRWTTPGHYTKKSLTPHREEENEDYSDNPQIPMRLQPRQPQFQHSQLDRSNIDFGREEAKNILNSQIDLISNEIKTNTESLAQKNLALMGFMKTFNVIPESWWFDSFDFNRWSNLFDIIQILDNTWDTKDGNIQALEYFTNQFMPKIMEYAWLSRWKRNEYQNKNSKKSEKIFNYDGNNENIQCLRDKTKDFEPNQFSWLANFETSHQLWFADLVKEKLITWDELNRKLDISKMESFIKDIETVDKEVDTELEKQLASID